jgi:transposase-like protein
MANKGQKFNKYSNDIKETIIKERQKGVSYSFLSRKYNISIGTLMTWYHKFNRPDLYPNQGQKKGPKKEKNLTKEDWKERYEILKKYQAFLKAQREKK